MSLGVLYCVLQTVNDGPPNTVGLDLAARPVIGLAKALADSDMVKAEAYALVPLNAAGYDPKYGRIWAERKAFHPGEPVFLLRGQDRASTQTVLDYLSHSAQARGGGMPEELVEAVTYAWRIMHEWQASHPELIKDAG